MRESGLFGLIQIVFLCARDGFSTARAWQIMAVFALLLALPVALLAGLIALLS